MDRNGRNSNEACEDEQKLLSPLAKERHDGRSAHKAIVYQNPGPDVVVHGLVNPETLLKGVLLVHEGMGGLGLRWELRLKLGACWLLRIMLLTVLLTVLLIILLKVLLIILLDTLLRMCIRLAVALGRRVVLIFSSHDGSGRGIKDKQIDEAMKTAAALTWW